MTIWRKGMEAVYVDNGKPWRCDDGTEDHDLTHGEVYIVCDMESGTWFESGIGLHLVGYDDEAYDSCHFRPVVKTAISIFEAMLLRTPAPKQTVRA